MSQNMYFCKIPQEIYMHIEVWDTLPQNHFKGLLKHKMLSQEWGLWICTFNKFPGDAAATEGLRSYFENLAIDQLNQNLPRSDPLISIF